MARVRNIVQIEQWPAHHRVGLYTALIARRRYNRRRKRFNWKDVSKRGFCKSWGRFLFWAQTQPWFDEALPIVAFVNPEHVAEFIADLVAAANKPATIRHRLSGLERITAALAPTLDRGWLKGIIAEFKKTGNRRFKRARIQLTDDLIRFAGQLADEADQLAVEDQARAARLFQTALQIMLLAYRAMRLKNLHQLFFDTDLVCDQDGRWRLELPPSATKNGNPYDPYLPDRVVDLLERFQVHRTALGGTPYNGSLWLFEDGSQQSARSINYHICKETKRRFKRSMCPHLFRDAVNTTVATYMPEHVRMGMNLIGNRDLTCTDEHYNQAERHIAAQKYNRGLDDYEDAA